ncbi:MAG TPA: hypothetical protein PKU80_04520 [Candidatus Limiplasma sp.]|nr:hypothetical protein [Candidatus Limiplasma sp.]HRX07712.1 hypothetical protein [Candidatus Limiplasma sp.]
MYKKLTVLLLCVALTLGLAGAVAYAADEPAPSIDFEDGLYGFVGLDMSAGNADESVLSVVDYNGSKALKVEVTKKVPYVIFEISALLGDDVAKLASVTMDIGIDTGADSKFYACSGRIYKYFGEANEKAYDEWSVYLASKNPNVAKMMLDEGEAFVAGAGNYIVVSKEVDNYATKTGGTPVSLYIDNVRFFDADGNVLPVDTAAMFVPRNAETDWSNLTVVDKEVDLGMAGAGGAWSQGADGVFLNDGGTLDPAIITEDSIITVYYSGGGKMWLVGVSGGNPNGDWIRIAQETAAINDSRTMAQITGAQIIDALGADFGATLAKLQCESDMDWEVTKVTIGEKADMLYGLKDAVDLGVSGAGGAWSQGSDIYTINEGGTFDPALIVPGTLFNINFAGEGNVWMVGVSGGNPNGDWIRIAQGMALQYGSNAQITYDQIVAALGEDFASTLARLQVESDMDWEVYAVTFGTALAPYVEAKSQVDLGASGAGGAWSQGADVNTINDGGTFDPALLVPGTVITVNYSGAGDMWLVGVSGGNPNGDWIRIAQFAASKNAKGDKVQISYDQIVSALGADFASTLARIQCESDQDWEVYSVTLGTAAE